MDRRNKKVRTKLAKIYTRIGLICLCLSLFLMSLYRGRYPVDSYFQYFLFYRSHDFITQMILLILSIIFFIKSLNLADKDGIIAVVVAIWCLIGAIASLSLSFEYYFKYPIPPSLVWESELPPGWIPIWLPSLFSTLILLGTSIFFFVIRNYSKNKLLSAKSIKKELLIDPKIDSDTRKNILAKSLDNTSLIPSLNCIKCSSNANLTSYKVSEKKVAHIYSGSTKYKVKIIEVPVCESCAALYNLWYSMHENSSRATLKGILSISPCGVILMIIFWNSIPWYINLIIVISIILLLLKYRIYYTEKDSPFRNVKFKLGNRVFVRPDNFKKWISLRDWFLYNMKSKETGEVHLSEIEIKLLDYLSEKKGSAFSPRALIKRVIGENFNEEYVGVISDLLKKLTKDGMINSDFQNGEYHYFY